MNVLREARRWLIRAGMMLLAVSAMCGCVAEQSPRATACDTELAVHVKATLRAAPAVNDTHIEVSCRDNQVVLSGLVEDDRALLDAIRIATRAAKGHSILNALTIEKTSPR